MNNKLTKITKPQIIISILLLFTALLILLIFSKKDLENTQTEPGLLLINTDKDHYTPGDEVYIQVTSISKNGTTRCDSQLEISITLLNSNITTNLPLTPTPACSDSNNLNYNPDYSTIFTPIDEGIYQITVNNLNNSDSAKSTVTVSNSIPNFSISRLSASRINPFIIDRYPMKITITSKDDFSGQIIEKVPNNLEIIWQGPAILEKFDDYQTLTWNIELETGESKDVIYEYRAPKTESTIYHLGKAMLVNEQISFEESRLWKIISNHE